SRRRVDGRGRRVQHDVLHVDHVPYAAPVQRRLRRVERDAAADGERGGRRVQRADGRLRFRDGEVEKALIRLAGGGVVLRALLQSARDHRGAADARRRLRADVDLTADGAVAHLELRGAVDADHVDV